MHVDLTKFSWDPDEPTVRLYTEVFRQFGIREPSPVFLAHLAWYLHIVCDIDPALPVVAFPQHITTLHRLYLSLVQDQPLERCTCTLVQTPKAKICIFADAYYENTDKGWERRKELTIPDRAFLICTVSVDFLMGILWQHYISVIGLNTQEDVDVQNDHPT